MQSEEGRNFTLVNELKAVKTFMFDGIGVAVSVQGRGPHQVAVGVWSASWLGDLALFR